MLTPFGLLFRQVFGHAKLIQGPPLVALQNLVYTTDAMAQALRHGLGPWPKVYGHEAMAMGSPRGYAHDSGSPESSILVLQIGRIWVNISMSWLLFRLWIGLNITLIRIMMGLILLISNSFCYQTKVQDKDN